MVWNMFKWTIKGALYGGILAFVLRFSRLNAKVRLGRYVGLGTGFGAGLGYQRSQEKLHRWMVLHNMRDKAGLPHVVEDRIEWSKLEKLEKKVLAHTGIPIEQFKIYNVNIDRNGNYIRTIEVGDPSKQTIVLIHGYGASTMNYYKVMKPLSENYHLIMIDIIGMGGSSRPLFNFTDPVKIDEFLVEWLERWRV